MVIQYLHPRTRHWKSMKISVKPKTWHLSSFSHAGQHGSVNTENKGTSLRLLWTTESPNMSLGKFTHESGAQLDVLASPFRLYGCWNVRTHWHPVVLETWRNRHVYQCVRRSSEAHWWQKTDGNFISSSLMRLFMVLLGCHWSHKTTTWHGDRRKSEPTSWSMLIRNAVRGGGQHITTWNRLWLVIINQIFSFFRNSDQTKPDLWKWLTMEFKQTLFTVFETKNLIRVIRIYTWHINNKRKYWVHVYEDILSFMCFIRLSVEQNTLSWNNFIMHLWFDPFFFFFIYMASTVNSVYRSDHQRAFNSNI